MGHLSMFRVCIVVMLSGRRGGRRSIVSGAASSTLCLVFLCLSLAFPLFILQCGVSIGSSSLSGAQDLVMVLRCRILYYFCVML